MWLGTPPPLRLRSRCSRGPASRARQLLLAASKADSAVERAATAGEPAHGAKYAFQIAQTFNNFCE